MSAVKIQIDRREFDKALREYVNYAKRDIPTIVNTKAFYIARRATVETPMVNQGEIKKQIRDLAVASGGGRGKKIVLKQSAKNGAPIAALIINKRRGEKGLPGLYGAKMSEAITKLLSGRIKGAGFLKSGWIWAIKRLEPYADKIGGSRIDNRAKAFGKPKGSAAPARQGWHVVATIINTVTAKWDKRELAETKAIPGFQRAIDYETRSTLSYIEKKLKASAAKAGIKTR